MNAYPGLLGGLGAACYRHRRLTLLAWIAGVACLITLWTMFGAAADNNYTGSDPGQALLSQHFPRASGDTLTGASIHLVDADYDTGPVIARWYIHRM